MTQTTMTTGIAGRQDLGLLASRQLLAVQLISIGRLTPHVIPFVPGTFVAISGRGPKGDSNESSKTTALAATSLLLGDSEWRLRGAGSQYAVGLLYDPPGLEHLAHAADQGYVIGLFAQAGEPPTELLTVWMRINRRSPHIEVKVQSGDGLLEFDDGQLVPALADDHWRSMTHIGKGASLGPRFAEALYGTSPRCIAHLTRRGNLKTRNASLLNAAAGGFGAEEIGDELVRLAGRQDILDDDMAQRSLLGAVTDQLKERQREAQEREREYEHQLRELDNRDRARGLLTTAQHDWDSHDARRLVDLQDARVEKQTAMDSELDRRSGLDERLAVAESAFAELGDDAQLRRSHDEAVAAMQLAEAAQEQAREALRDARGEADRLRYHALTLRSEADGWTGDLADAETAARLALDDLTQRERELAVAEADVTRAEQALRQAEEGRGDAAATLDRLGAAGVPAVGLLDAVELDLVGRQQIEPLLWPYRDAVVVAQEDIDAALEAVAGIPWAVLISGPADAPPAGVRSCPAGAGRFLAALAARSTVEDDPARVADAELGLSVIAGVEALTGRGARVRSARTRVEMATSALREATDLRERAALMASGADDELRRAQAAAALVEAEEEARQFEDAVNGTTTRLGGADATLMDAREYERELDVTLRGLEAESQRAQERVDVLRQAITDHETTLSGLWVDLQSLSDSIGFAESAWGRGEQAARERCASEGRDSGTLRNRANIDLHEALYAIGMSRQDDHAPTDELLAAWRARRADENTPFPQLAGPLGEYLGLLSEQDEVLRTRIEEDRSEVADALAASEANVLEAGAGLERIQDAIHSQIETEITRIGEQFARLDAEAGGYGALLKMEVRPPLEATDKWRWLVTPMWKRSPDGNFVPYTAATNSAQDKLYTVHLVLAALLAVPNPAGRVLVLDELGDSLGAEHRRDVLRGIAETAQAKGITVLGTCQDDVLHHAAEFTQEIVFFEYAHKRDLINKPVRLFGFDPQGRRVETTREAVLWGRPAV
ncbi:MAG: chromosome segregation protein [Solirubrobacteraceae bacterium]|jgi:hypothetical protein|nr:chromosome segregation protein [Solirubrobacteraceae bacterium]